MWGNGNMSELLTSGWLGNIFSKGARGIDAQAGLKFIASSCIYLSSTGVTSMRFHVQTIGLNWISKLLLNQEV